MPRYQTYRSWGDLAHLRGQRIALTVGIFDGIHRGHVAVFNLTRELAADFGGIPLIFTFANHPLTVLEPERAIHYLTLHDEKVNLLHRMKFGHVACFNFTRRFSQLTAQDFLARIAANCQLRTLVTGYDARLGHNRLNARKLHRLRTQFGFDLVQVEEVRTDGAAISSRRIRELVSAGELPQANRLLLYPFFVRARVSRGKGVGRRILGIPTANILVPPGKILPPEGVYAGSFHREHRHHPVAAFISDPGRPRAFLRGVEHTGPLSAPAGTRLLEAHIIGHEFELTGHTAEFILLERIRGRREFRKASRLRARIKEDISVAVRIFEKNRIDLQFLP